MLRLYLYARVHVLFAQIAHGTAGAACTRSSLRPHLFERAKRECKTRANMSREGEIICTVIALANHGDRSGRIRSTGPAFTTFTCIDDSGYNASAAKTLQSREQSRVPKMSPF